MKLVLLSLSLVLFLSACSPETLKQPTVVPATEAAPASTQSASESLTRTDEQEAVVVEVTPLNLDEPRQTLDFQVSLNTHSVDLSMDLSTLATLTTDTGVVVQAVSWDGQKGGHHVSGTLSFPASMDGRPVLGGATKLTLTIKNVYAPERVFTWDLQ